MKTRAKSIIKSFWKGTLQGVRFFFIMFFFEIAIEGFFIFSGVNLGHGDQSEYVNWLFIFALTFYLYHYMITIKWGKTINSINIDLRNRNYIYNLEFYLSDVIIPYFLYIGAFYISTFITGNYNSELTIFVFLYPLYGLFVRLLMLFAKIALGKHPKLITVINKIINASIIVVISILFICFCISTYYSLN